MTRAGTALTTAGAVVAGLCGLDGGQPAAGEALVVRSGDAERGRQVFQRCFACHSVVAGERGLTGPNLAGVVGRAVASVEGFGYSAALEALPGRGIAVWSESALDGLVTDPEAYAPGTAMTFVGLRDAGERADLLAYLSTTESRDGWDPGDVGR